MTIVKNQKLLNPKQLICWENYVNPYSKTFNNALKSALVAGYKPHYARTITATGWLHEKVIQTDLLGLAERFLEEVLEMSHIRKVIRPYNPNSKWVVNEDVYEVDKDILETKIELAIFVVEKLGRKHEYSK